MPNDVSAEVVLTTARTFLNDDSASLFTDPVLFPKLQQAHKELQIQLKLSQASTMKATSADTVISAGTLIFPLPADLVEPIKLWERAPTDPNSLYMPMTEADPLPPAIAQATLIYWNWYQETISFIGATASRTVRMQYWRALPLPQVNTDTIGFINGELYLAPRVAALAGGSLGRADLAQAAAQVATSSLDTVILSNKGRLKPQDGTSPRP